MLLCCVVFFIHTCINGAWGVVAGCGLRAVWCGLWPVGCGLRPVTPTGIWAGGWVRVIMARLLGLRYFRLGGGLGLAGDGILYFYDPYSAVLCFCVFGYMYCFVFVFLWFSFSVIGLLGFWALVFCNFWGFGYFSNFVILVFGCS